jgi:hypothetical protein
MSWVSAVVLEITFISSPPLFLLLPFLLLAGITVPFCCCFLLGALPRGERRRRKAVAADLRQMRAGELAPGHTTQSAPVSCCQVKEEEEEGEEGGEGGKGRKNSEAEE